MEKNNHNKGDIQSPALLYFKAILFLVTGVICAAILLLQNPTLQTLGLLIVMAWAFARAYYFVFYVIQHYIDPNYKFAGLWSVMVYLRNKKR